MSVNQSLYDEVMSCANIISGDEYKTLFCTIAKVVSDTVSQTLGPYGSTTIIDDGNGFTYPTKDGWSCMNRLRFNDPVYNTIFGIIKQVSFNSVSTVGDGTTTAMIATSAFLDRLDDAFKKMADLHVSQAQFLDRMNVIVDGIINDIRNSPRVKHINPDGDFEDIRRVAYISTNGNEQFSKMIQEIYKETKNPNIRVEIDNGSPETTYKIEKGYRFDCKPIAFSSYVNDESGIIRKDDKPSKVMIFDHNVTYQMHRNIITGVSQLAATRNEEYIILAPYFDDIVCSIIQNNAAQMLRNGTYPNVMLVQIPTSLNMHQLAISDIGILTNSLIFTETLVKVFNTMLHNQTCTDENDIISDPVMDLPQFAKYEHPQQILEDCSGIIRSVVFEPNEGYIQDFDQVCNRERYENLLREVKDEYLAKKEKATKTINGLLDKDYLFTQMRYIKLSGNSGTIKVGGLSDIQKRCDKDAIDDAVLACRSAYDNGYVRGMSLEIIKTVRDRIDHLDSKTKIQYKIDLEVLHSIDAAFMEVFKTLFRNKYGEEDVNDINAILNINAILTKCCDRNLSFNLRTNDYEEEGKWTVINSVQTDTEILLAMSNILTTIMTSNQFLSMNRSCDMKVTRQKALEQRISDESAIALAKANAFFKAFDASSCANGIPIYSQHYDMLQRGVHPASEDDDDDDDDWVQY